MSRSRFPDPPAAASRRDYPRAMDRSRGVPKPPAPETVDEALARGLQHARNSASEALLAARALMDALSILLADQPVARHAEPSSPIAHVAEAIERWARTLRGPTEAPDSPGLPAILEAVEIEIARWQERARSDTDARTVLRAFLGVREILWEFGEQPAPRSRSNNQKAPSRSPKAARAGANRH